MEFKCFKSIDHLQYDMFTTLEEIFYFMFSFSLFLVSCQKTLNIKHPAGKSRKAKRATSITSIFVLYIYMFRLSNKLCTTTQRKKEEASKSFNHRKVHFSLAILKGYSTDFTLSDQFNDLTRCTITLLKQLFIIICDSQGNFPKSGDKPMSFSCLTKIYNRKSTLETRGV